MTIQSVSLLSTLRGYLKACIPFTAILLSLASSSLTLADSNQAYVRVWNPTGTQSIEIRDDVSITCSNSLEGGYQDLGWRGKVGTTLTISAHDQQGCQGNLINRASASITHPGDCWFDLPREQVTGICVATTLTA